MANHIVKRGKLFVDVFYKPEIQREFELHRDIKSCLSIGKAQKLVNDNEQLYLNYGKTAFLQFWNNFPLFFPFHYFNHYLPKHLEKMQNLTVYQQQLRLAILYKVKDFVQTKQAKQKLNTQIQVQYKRIINQIQVRPYDIINANSFLFFQKDSSTNEIFLHCIDIFKKSNYSLLLPVFPRITPMIIRRLNLNDWNTLRQFKNLLDFIVYDFSIGDVAIKYNISALNLVAILQLHLVGYHRIPKYIDQVMALVCRNLERENNLDGLLIQCVFENFKYLPINYNEKAYKLIYKRLLERIQEKKQFFHADKLPYIRMTNEQVKQIYDIAFINSSLMSIIHYIGNKDNVRQYLKQMNYVPQLYRQFKQLHSISFKKFMQQIISCSIFIDYYQNNETLLAQVKQLYIKKATQFQKEIPLTRTNLKTISLCNIFNLQLLEQAFSFIINPTSEYLFNEFQKRQHELSNFPFLDMVEQALLIHYNTSNKIIIDWINTIITKLVMAFKKFNFKYFTSFLLLLIKSEQSSAYDQSIKLLFSRLQKTDTPFFIELYNRYPTKTMKMNRSMIQLIWQKHPSFKSIGKLLLSNNYVHYTSPKGQLQIQIKTFLESLEPGLNLQDLKDFTIPQMVSILRFLRHFKRFTIPFSTKFLPLALTVAEEMDIEHLGIKNNVMLFQQISVLQAELNLSEAIRAKTMKYLQKVKLLFKESPLLKVKELQIRWILGLVQSQDRVSLIVSDILDDLSQSNYSPNNLDVVLTLLKLYAFEVIQLDPLVRQKLVKISLHSVEDELIGIGQIINSTHLLTKKGGVMINLKKGEPLIQILKKSISLIRGKQNFQFYIHFIEVGRLCQDQQLIKLGCKQLIKIKLFPSQIRKILNIIKFFPYIELNEFRQKLINSTFQMSSYLQAQLPQILYTVHSLRDQTPKNQSEIYRSLFNKCQIYLLKVLNGTIKQRQKYNTNLSPEHFFIIKILKFLWVSIKSNNINEKSYILFKFIQAKFSLIRSYSSSKQMDGVNWESIYYIKFYFHKLKEQQIQKNPETKRNKVFNTNAQYAEMAYQRFPQQQFLRKKIKFQKYELKSPVLKKLEQHHLRQVKISQANESDNCFVCNFSKNGVIIPIWIKKNKKEYGILILDTKSFNENNQKRGRVNFFVNIFTAITEIQIIAVAPGISFELN